MSDPQVQLLSKAIDHAEHYVAGVTPETGNRATPCPEMDVAAVASHLAGGLRGFADAAAGRPVRFDLDPELSGQDVAETYRTAADAFLSQCTPDMLERTFSMPWGETTGRQLVGFELIEVLTHGWDLARGLGQDGRMPTEAAQAALSDAQHWVTEEMRSPGMFGPAHHVTTDADVTDRLVAFLGRDPQWVG